MDDSTIVKLAAIAALTLLEIVNLLTAQLDGSILMSLGAIIGGIAGYEFGRRFGGRGRGKAGSTRGGAKGAGQ